MVGQLRSEAHHFPPRTIARWQSAGPQAVQAEVARRLVELGDRGLLDLTNSARAAAHFSAITLAESMVRPTGSPPLTAAETERMVRAAVDSFLRGYGRRQPQNWIRADRWVKSSTRSSSSRCASADRPSHGRAARRVGNMLLLTNTRRTPPGRASAARARAACPCRVSRW